MGGREANRIVVMVLFLCGLGARFIVSVVEFGGKIGPELRCAGMLGEARPSCPFGLHDAQAAPGAPALPVLTGSSV